MIYRLSYLLLFYLLPAVPLIAQKPFTEGVISYRVKLESRDHKEFAGTYTFTIKGNQVRKEIKLNNGYRDIVLINSGTNKVYSLQNRNNKKYVIELSMADIIKRQEKFGGFTVSNEENNTNKVAGCAQLKGNINYKDGSNVAIFYTREWYPSQAITFERFPAARFLPLSFAYTDEDSISMQFDAEKIEPGPVENAVFRIPPDYKMITNEEYRQLSK